MEELNKRVNSQFKITFYRHVQVRLKHIRKTVGRNYWVTLLDKIRMARVRSVSTDETSTKSLPRQFRVLALPIALMALFGFLGHRPGQFFRGCSSYLFNSYVIFNCCFVFIHAINDLVNNHTINFISFIFFNISAILLVFILTYKFYKKNNLYSLLLGVNDAYTNTSSKEHIFAVLLLVAVVISSLIYWLYITVPYLIKIFTSDERFEFKWFTMNITEPTTVKMLELIRSWGLGLKWMCFYALVMF